MYDMYCVCMGCVHSTNERSCGECVFLQEKTNGALGPQLHMSIRPLWLAVTLISPAAPCTCCWGSTHLLAHCCMSAYTWHGLWCTPLMWDLFG